MSTATEIRTATTPHTSPSDGEAARTLVPHLGQRRRSMALVLLVSAQFVVMLDTSIVNVALPSIQTDLGLSSTGVTWVVNAYVLAFGGLFLLSGRAADLFGRRRMFIAGSSLFTVGTLMAAAAHDQGLLVVGRLVQGAGAAALSPAAMSLLLLTFPGQQRAKAMSIWGAASALGGATGVMVGGLLAGSFGWSSVFLVTVPVSLAAVVLASFRARGRVPSVRDVGSTDEAQSPSPEQSSRSSTVPSRAADHGWTSPTVVASLATAALLLAAFVVIERRTTDPLVPLELFRSPDPVHRRRPRSPRRSRPSIHLRARRPLPSAGARHGPAAGGTGHGPHARSPGSSSRSRSCRGSSAPSARSARLVIGLVVLAAGHLWLAYAPREPGTWSRSCPGCCSSPSASP